MRKTSLAVDESRYSSTLVLYMSAAYCKHLVSAIAVPCTFVSADDNGDNNDI